MQCVRGNADGRKDYKMKQKYYELSLLFYKDISESDITRVEQAVREKGWSIVQIVEEGVQPLRYPIRGWKVARRRDYVLRQKGDDPDTPLKTSTILNSERAVLRYLLSVADAETSKRLKDAPELLPANDERGAK